MADKTITGIVTWLKGWFFDKDEITTKENALQTQINNKASQSDLNTLSSVVSGKADSVHTHSTSDMAEASALSHIGTSANANQHNINVAIDGIIGNLTGAEIIKVVTALPTASASTTNALYLLSRDNQYDIYITIEDGGSYNWELVDEDVLADLSVAWNDITGKPSTFTPSAHNQNDTTVSNTNNNFDVLSNNLQNQYDVNRDVDANLNSILNTSLPSKANKTQVVDWDTLTLVPKSTDSTGAITFDYLE